MNSSVLESVGIFEFSRETSTQGILIVGSCLFINLKIFKHHLFSRTSGVALQTQKVRHRAIYKGLLEKF